MNSFLLYTGMAALAGTLLPLQALINAHLAAGIKAPLMATFISFAVGTAVLFFVILAMRTPAPAAAQLGNLPWWAWLGGFLGAYFVLTATMAVPTLGAAGLTAIVIAGQLISSIALDHFGVLHTPTPVTPVRIAGALMLMGGAFLVLRPEN